MVKVEDLENEITDPVNSYSNVKESVYGWLIVIACGYCFGINIGITDVYSLIYNEFIVAYNTTENYVVYSAWIGSSSVGIRFSFCIIASCFVDIFGSRKTAVMGGLVSSIGLLACGFVNDIKLYFLTFSVLFGVGQSFLVIGFLSILPHYFNERIGLANGVMTFVGCFIMTTIPFAVEASLTKLGLSNTFFILAGMCFVTVLASLTFKPQLPTVKHDTFVKRIKKSFGLKLFKSRGFLVWIIGSFIGCFGYHIPIVTMSHFSAIQYPTFSPAIIAAVFGACSGFSGIILGYIGDHWNVTPLYFFILSFIIGGVSQIIFGFIKSFIASVILMGAYGVANGIFLSFIVPISLEIAESPKLANQATGYFFMTIAIPTVVGPAVAGVVFEKIAGYEFAYFGGGTVLILAAIFIFMFHPDALFCKTLSKVFVKDKFKIFGYTVNPRI